MQVEGDRPGVSINCVVFATDFSSCSENAERYAHLLARYYAAKLVVAHAFVPSQAAMEAEALSKILSRDREDASSRLSRVAHALSTGGVDAEPVLLEGGTASMIATLAERRAPSLIVLGTHGAGRMEREFIGSTAEKILRSTPWPCLIAGPHVPMASNHAVPFQRILYATDFTPAAAHAAIYAVSLASEAGASIDMLNVVPVNTIEHPDRLSELQKHFLHALEQLVPDQAREFCSARAFVDTGNAHSRIREHIKQHNNDLLVIGMRKSSHLDLIIRTSPAFQLVVESPCPVLTIRS